MEIHVYPVQIDRFCVQSTMGVELMRERVPKSMATFVLLSVTSEEGVQKMVLVGCAQQPLSWWGNPAPKCLIGSHSALHQTAQGFPFLRLFPPRNQTVNMVFFGIASSCT